jgi:hypothetical protein
MNKLLIGSMLVIGVVLTTPVSAALSEADCQALWKKADANGDGKVAGQEAKPYMTAMAGEDSNTMGEVLEAGEFLNACRAGAFDNMKM